MQATPLANQVKGNALPHDTNKIENNQQGLEINI